MEDEEARCIRLEPPNVLPGGVIGPHDGNHASEKLPCLENLVLTRLEQKWQPLFRLVQQLTRVFALATGLSVALTLAWRLLLDRVVDMEGFPLGVQLLDFAPASQMQRSIRGDLRKISQEIGSQSIAFRRSIRRSYPTKIRSHVRTSQLLANKTLQRRLAKKFLL
jgi:hypothetical protein